MGESNLDKEKWFLKCTNCFEETREDDFYIHCPKCKKGFLEVIFPQPNKKVDETKKSLLKYHEFMPFEEKHLAFLEDKEDYEDTPLFYAKNISEQLGIQLYMKDELILPTGTWKDREGLISIYRLWRNNIPEMVLFSSGNTGTSLCRSATIFQEQKLVLIVPTASKQRIAKLNKFFDPKYVEVIYFDGSNDECVEYSKQVAAERGLVGEGGFSNYARREGLKLLGLEYIFGFDEVVDWYVQPIAGGIGIYSFDKAHRDVGIPCPKMLGVQSDICDPMVRAWKADSPVLKEEHVPEEVYPSDFVRVLRTRKPFGSYPILYEIMKRVGGRFEDVSDEEIYAALRLFYEEPYYKDLRLKEGITIGLEPATALAGVVKGVKEGYILPGEKVLLNVSGAAKKGDVKEEWIADLF